MGYYTHYKFSSEFEIEEALAALAEINPDYFGDAELPEEPLTWYSYEEDCKQLSLQLPGRVFRLEGEGEDMGDHWVRWFRDGTVKSWDLTYTVPENPEDIR